MNIEASVQLIFEENGVDPYNSASIENIDSIQYVTIIVEIEQLLNITLPDYFFSDNWFLDYNKLINIINDIYQNSISSNDEQTSNAMLSKNNEKVI